MSKFNLKENIKALRKSIEQDEFEPFIRHIRFPYFKNLELNARIDFQFPITVLVGQNGTNKSSVIKALFGCPNGKSITRYWFSTETDDVPDLKLDDGTSLKPRYIYGYKNSEGQIIEILQTRINATKQSLDYWETSRPLISDQMKNISVSSSAESNATRWKKISKGLVFLDFRSEISAFDRCMYHSDFKSRKMSNGKRITKQDYIRSKTKYIKKALDEKLTTLTLWGNERIVKNITLKKDLVQAVSYILGRSYKDIKYLEHRLWGVRGGTTLLTTDKLNYTEAYAGSGEFAVVSLVLQLFNAKPYSLILLDEPEVSLHPGAQKRMMELLFQLVMNNKFQVVVSTHSPTLVNFLPKDAVKLFLFESESEVVKITQNISPNEAFIELGHDISKKTIVVEDKLAREIILKAISGSSILTASFNVEYIPGGSETILSKHLPSHAAVNREDIIFLLDGDKNKKLKTVKIESIADTDLVKKMKEYFGCEFIVNSSGGNGIANNTEVIKIRRQILSYAFKRILYLPFNTPEELLIMNCCSDEQSNLLKSAVWDVNDVDIYKKQIELLTQHHIGSEVVNSEEIFFMQKHLISKIDADSTILSDIRNLITQALERGIIN